jgi:predicted metal-dependent enzyme (double-stranded beta helix superfamily)
MKITDLITQISSSLDCCRDALKQYDEEDWKQYVSVSHSNYKKVQVFANDMFEIFIITWNVGQGAGIHNHPENCYMKLLKGKLTECIYDNDLNFVSGRLIQKNEIGFMNEHGFHSIQNVDNKISVSCHVYFPPNFKTEYIDL